MTKETAILKLMDIDQLIEALIDIGYQFANPSTGEVIGWDSKGERQLLETREKAHLFLREGNGIQLWLTNEFDIFLSVSQDSLYVDFDGFSEEESASVKAHIKAAGICFKVECDC